MIRVLLPDEVMAAWESAEPILQRALDKFDYGSDSDHILLDLLNGNRQLWIIGVFDAVAITSVKTLPKFSVLDISLLAGDNIEVWLEKLVSQLTMYAKACGCKYVDGFGRKGWTRKLESHGFKPYSYDVRLKI